VAAALARRLEVQINVRNAAKHRASLSSYENMLQGYWHFKKLSRSGNLAARDCFERAVALDPSNAEAMGWLGVTYCEQWVQDFTEEHAAKGAEIAARAVALDPANAVIHAVHAWILMCVGDRAEAVRASERSMALNPGDPAVLINRALALAYDGDTQQALHCVALSHRLEPLPPPWFGEFAGVVAFAGGRYEDTLAGVESLDDNAWDAMYALACYGHLDRREKARALLERYRRQGREPDWNLGMTREAYSQPETRERLADGLRKALALAQDTG
jgi:tetratricopeptide (TPR) repeat protein